MLSEGWCHKCRCKRLCITSEEHVKYNAKGYQICVKEIVARCHVCNMPMYVPEINDLNVERRNEALTKTIKGEKYE